MHRFVTVYFLLFLISQNNALGQRTAAASIDDLKGVESFLDSLIHNEIQKNHIPGVVISIVKDGKVFFTKGYGYSNLSLLKPVDPEKTIFRIGSITKVFTVMAVLQLADKGRIKLQEGVNNYLSAFKITEKYGQPITVANLLTHSAGLDEISKGRMVTAEKELIPPGEFLRNRLIPIRPAGEISSYNTYGISLAGYIVEKLTGLSLNQYFQKQVFGPLKMNSSNLGTIDNNRLDYLATGYDYSKEKGFKPLDFVWFNTYPASDINSTAADMSHFMIALLNGGRYEKNKILSTRMIAQMLTEQHTNFKGIPGWTYGLQVSRKLNGQGGVEHGGSMDDGYSSLLYLSPENNLGFFIAGNRESTNMYEVVRDSFIRRYFPMYEKPVVQAPADLKVNLQRFEGKYLWDPYCHSCKDSSAFYAQSVIIKQQEGALNFWGGRWVQVKPLLFLLADGLLAGQVYIGFREDGEGKIAHMFLGGPWTYEKVLH